MPGDVPNEIWRLVLEPQYLKAGHTMKFGVGHTNKFDEPTAMQKLIHELIKTIDCTEHLPLRCRTNLCHQIPKKMMSHE